MICPMPAITVLQGILFLFILLSDTVYGRLQLPWRRTVAAAV